MGELINIYTDISMVGLILIGILICIIMMIVLATLDRVAFVFAQKINKHNEIKSAWRYIVIIIFMILVIIIWGYCNTKDYYEYLNNVKTDLENSEKFEIKGFIYDVEEKEKSIYVYVEKVSIKLDDERVIRADKVLLIKYLNKIVSDNKLKPTYLSESEEFNDIQVGRYISAIGEHKEYKEVRNEGGFDEEKYYNSIGITCKAIIYDYTINDNDSIKSMISNKLFNLRNILSERLDEIAKEKYSGIYKGILLGDKSFIDENTLDLYKISGISHILSISGLHISLIGYFIYKQLRKYRGFIISTMISFVLVYLYSVMIGTGFSTKRALIMFSISILANMIGRSYDLLTALSLAGIIIVIDNPMAIFNTGLLLSFVAIIGIEPMYKLISKVLDSKNKIINTFFTSLCINAVTMPILINSYYEISMYSPIVNVLILGVAGYMVGLGFVGSIVSFININLGKVIIYPGCVILKIYEFICEKVALLPGAVKVVSHRSIERICVYYFILGLGLICFCYIVKVSRCLGGNDKLGQGSDKKCKYKKGCIIRFFIVVMYLLFSFVFLIYSDNKETNIKMIDVGQGDSIFIQDEGVSILIDAGSSSESALTEYTIIPFLKYNGVSRIDYLILTHADADHGGSFKELLSYKINNKGLIENLVLPNIADSLKDELYMEIEETAKEKDINIIYLSRGMYFKYADSVIECLWPIEKEESIDKNSLSIVLKYVKDDFSMLFTGDLTEEAEQRLIEICEDDGLDSGCLESDVLKVGHHGSKDSSSGDFLALVKPKLALISCGENNIYGHPHQETIERLNNVRSNILNTAKVGQITINKKQKNGFVIVLYEAK